MRQSKKYENKAITGVYFLYSEDEIVYVGQSLDIHFRIGEHRKANSKIFTHYSYFQCKFEVLNIEERKYIKKHNPKYNIIHVDSTFIKDLDSIVDETIIQVDLGFANFNKDTRKFFFNINGKTELVKTTGFLSNMRFSSCKGYLRRNTNSNNNVFWGEITIKRKHYFILSISGDKYRLDLKK